MTLWHNNGVRVYERYIMNLDTINKELQLIADQSQQEYIDDLYDEFMDEMYYLLQCDQWERDMEFYEFG